MRYGWGLGDVWLVRSSKTISGPKEILTQPFQVVGKALAQQHDSYNCGPFSMMYLTLLSMNPSKNPNGLHLTSYINPFRRAVLEDAKDDYRSFPRATKLVEEMIANPDLMLKKRQHKVKPILWSSQKQAENTDNFANKFSKENNGKLEDQCEGKSEDDCEGKSKDHCEEKSHNQYKKKSEDQSEDKSDDQKSEKELDLNMTKKKNRNELDQESEKRSREKSKKKARKKVIIITEEQSDQETEAKEEEKSDDENKEETMLRKHELVKTLDKKEESSPKKARGKNVKPLSKKTLEKADKKEKAERTERKNRK